MRKLNLINKLLKYIITANFLVFKLLKITANFFCFIIKILYSKLKVEVTKNIHKMGLKNLFVEN